MKRLAAKVVKKRGPWVPVPRKDVAALFKTHYSHGPWPTEFQCEHLAHAIDIVQNKELPPVKNATPHYRDRRRVFEAIFKLVEKQIEVHHQFPGLRFPPLIRLEELRAALEAGKDALLAPANPLAGERRGAEWHFPAHFLAGYVEDALRAADLKKRYRNKKISRDKGGPFVLVVADALELAGLKKPTPEAVAAVLQKPTT